MCIDHIQNMFALRISVILTFSSFLTTLYFVQIAAGDVMEFLRKASEENAKIHAGSENILDAACLTEYKKIQCRTFVSTCSETRKISKESCEQKLNW